MTYDPKRAFIAASSHVLTEQFPDSVSAWKDETINKFCEENAWEPFQYWDGAQIHEHINDLAAGFIIFTTAGEE